MGSLFPITDQWSWSTFILYVICAYLVCGFCKLGAKGNRKKVVNFKKNSLKINYSGYYILAFLILAVLGTIRTYEVGADTERYVTKFLTVTSFEFDWTRLFDFHQIEPGYQLLIYLIRRITSNYHVYFIVIFVPLALAYISFIKHFYNKEDTYVFLPIFIFYYVSNMSGIRSALGTIFLLYSFIQLDKKKYIKATFLTVIASCFHYTMLYNLYIIFMSWFFRNPKIRRKKWLWILGILAGIIVSNLGLSNLLSIFEDTKYGYYSRGGGNESILGSLIFVVFGIIALLIYKEVVKEKDNRISLLIIGLSFLVTYPMIYSTGAYRIPYYYIMPRLVVWNLFTDKMLKKFDGKSQHICKIVISIVVLLFLLFRFTKSSLDGGFAYKI